MSTSLTEISSLSSDGITDTPESGFQSTIAPMDDPPTFDEIRPRSAFALRFARLRVALGYTQEELAKILNVSRSRLSGWENDDSFIRHPEVDKMRELSKLDADFILFGDTDGLTVAQERWLLEKGVIESLLDTPKP